MTEVLENRLSAELKTNPTTTLDRVFEIYNKIADNQARSLELFRKILIYFPVESTPAEQEILFHLKVLSPKELSKVAEFIKGLKDEQS